MQSDLFDITDEDLDAFREKFNKREWERIKDRLEIVLRDRSIRREFKYLRGEGYTWDKAIRALSEKHYLSESQINKIVYPRKK